MSSVVTYRVKDIKLDASIFSLFEQTHADKNEIDKLSKLSDEVMTVTQSKQLVRLKQDVKTIVYNGIMITTKDNTQEPEALIYYNKINKTLSIPGHEGNDLRFKLAKDTFNYITSNDYFDDNYDSHLGPLQDIIEKFRCSCTIEYSSDEMDSGEDVPDMVYVKGKLC